MLTTLQHIDNIWQALRKILPALEVEDREAQRDPSNTTVTPL
jgi:hypothetical protein